MFYVAYRSVDLLPESVCKVTAFFLTSQIFRHYLTHFNVRAEVKSGESEGNELREWTLRVQEIVHGFLGFNTRGPKAAGFGHGGAPQKRRAEQGQSGGQRRGRQGRAGRGGGAGY